MAILRSKPINGKTLFFTTSPRTPFKVLPEIKLLVNKMEGEVWNPETQRKFYQLLVDNDFLREPTLKLLLYLPEIESTEFLKL